MVEYVAAGCNHCGKDCLVRVVIYKNKSFNNPYGDAQVQWCFWDETPTIGEYAQ